MKSIFKKILSTNNCMEMLNLLIILILSFKFVHSNEQISKIRGVLVTNQDNEIARKSIEHAFNHYQSPNENQLKLKQVILNDGDLNGKDICKRVFDDGFDPMFMIDASEWNDGTPGANKSHMIKNLAREMGLTTISTTYSLGKGISIWNHLDEIEKQILIHVDSPGDVIPQMIKDLVNHYNIEEFVILYDESFEFEHKHNSLVINTNSRHVVRRLNGNTISDYALLLNQVKKAKSYNNYFVFGSIPTLNKVLEAANKNEMLNIRNTWFMITKGKGKLECLSCNQTELFFAQPLKTRLHEYDHQTELRDTINSTHRVDAFFYYDLTRFVIEVIDEMVNKSLWPETISFPKCGKRMTDEEKEERKQIQLGKELSFESFYGMFGRFVFDAYQLGNNYQEIVMRINKVVLNNNKLVKNTKIAEWEYEGHTGTLMFTSRVESDKPGGSRHFKIVTIIQPPFVMRKSDNSTSDKTQEFYGYCIDLLKQIQNHTDPFTYEITEVSDGKFGNKQPDGKWSGMIGYLNEKNADIALGPISVMAERETVVDFTVPYYDLVGITILMRKPAVPSHLFKFLTVLEKDVWLCILAAYFFTSFLMYLFDRLSPYSYHNNKEKYKDDDEKREFTLKECLWFCMTSLTPQGGGEAPRNLSGRLVAATWWLFGFIIIASYTANLAAFLTVSRLDSPIESLDDLAKQYKIKYAPQDGTSTMTYFERMAGIEEKFYEIWKDMSLNDSLDENERAKLAVWDYPVSDKYTKIWAQIQEADMPKSWNEGVERVKKSDKANEGFALIGEATMVKYAVMTNCDLQSVGNEFSRKPLALAVQQGSKLKDELSSAILKLLNLRKLEILKETWWNKNPEKKPCQDSRKQSDGISINNIGGVFIVIFIGVVLACITLMIEYWYFGGKKDGAKVVAVKSYGNPQATRALNNNHVTGMRNNGIMGSMNPGLTMGPMAGIQ